MGRYDPNDFESVRAAMERYERVKLFVLFTFFVLVAIDVFVLKIGYFILLMLIGIPLIVAVSWIWWGYLVNARAMVCNNCGAALASFLFGGAPKAVCSRCGQEIESSK